MKLFSSIQAISLLSISFLGACEGRAVLDRLEDGFQDPALTYGPHVFWHWINGNIRREALDTDLSAMKAAGHGGALIYNVQAGMPKGSINYGSDEWLDLLVYAVDGLKQRGMLAAMHNAPGYSGIGSKELPANMSMKELVWTETIVSSNSSNITLPKPLSKMDVYQDLFTLAYPVLVGEGTVFRDAVANLSITGVPVISNITETINLDDPLRLNSSSDYIDIEMNQLFTAQAVAIYRLPETPINAFDGARDFPPSWTLKVSNDSSTWTSVAVSVNAPALRKMDAPAVITFSFVKARHFRLQPTGSTWITGIDISSSARLSNWAIKSHGAPGTISSNPATVLNASEAIDPSTVIDISDKVATDGRIDWTPSNGTYTVVRLGYTVTGQDMPATPDDFGGLSVDLVSRKAIDVHFDTYLSRIISAMKPYIPDTFYGVEVDSYELGQQNWGGDLEADFLALRGYSLRPWILAATGRILESTESTERFLYDFRLTHANLIRSNCYGYFQERLGELGLALLIEPYGDGPFDSMELASVADFSFGEFWSHYTYGSDGYSELGSSGVNAKHTSLQMPEAFTGQPDTAAWTEHPYQMKAEADRMMTFGINRFILHSYTHQPVDAAFPGMTFGPFGANFDRMSTFAEYQTGWNEHVARVSYIMQNALTVTSVACFVSEEPSASAVITYNSPYYVPLSYQADIFSRQNLLNMTSQNGTATYPSGTRYSLLVFPDLPSASVAVLTKILELARGGVPILLLSATPTNRAIGLADTNGEVVNLATELWDMVGNGNVFVGETTTAVLKTLDIAPDLNFTSSSNDASIYYIHKVTADDDDVYFISNGLRKQVTAVLSLLGKGTPEILHPTTGKITKISVSLVSEGRTLLSYDFGPSESIIVFLRSNPKSTVTSLTTVAKDGVDILSATPFSSVVNAPYANVSSSFTVSLWAKPEVAQYGTTGYIFYPTIANAYGSGHAASSLAFGWNGIELGQATASSPSNVLTQTFLGNNFTASGWTHLAVVYTENTPSIYINGVLLATGSLSAYTVHPGVGMPDAVVQMNKRFEGDLSSITVYPKSLSADEIKDIHQQGIPSPDRPPSVQLQADNQALIRQNGSYTFSGVKTSQTLNISSIHTKTLNTMWNVRFPSDRLTSGRGALNITMPNLISLKDHSDFDVAHFSGTATYRTTFSLDSVMSSLKSEKETTRILLNLGRVENLASVTVNSQYLGLSWLPPYEIDITSAVKTGSNSLVVMVTNAWPNRLIGDESLPKEAVYNSTQQDYAVESWPEWFVEGMAGRGYNGGDFFGNDAPRKPGKRVTFPAWKKYNETDPLFESGLLGPVTLTKAVLVDISAT